MEVSVSKDSVRRDMGHNNERERQPNRARDAAGNGVNLGSKQSGVDKQRWWYNNIIDNSVASARV
jgi:hypothetical protein